MGTREQTARKCGQRNYRIVHHFQKYAEKCIERDIPAPFASEMTKNTLQLLKSLGLEEKRRFCRCFRCHLDLTSTKTVSFRLSVSKRKMKKNKKIYKRQCGLVQLVAVCKGCGAEMKGGTLATEEFEERDMQASTEQRLRPGQRRFSEQSTFSSPGISCKGTPTFVQVNKKISSSVRRRKSTSKLQRVLTSQTPIRKETSLQGFLEAFKINI